MKPCIDHLCTSLERIANNTVLYMQYMRLVCAKRVYVCMYMLVIGNNFDIQSVVRVGPPLVIRA